MTKTLVVWHDNGMRGTEGFSDHTAEEVEAKGGVDAIIKEYTDANIIVYEWRWYCE